MGSNPASCTDESLRTPEAFVVLERHLHAAASSAGWRHRLPFSDGSPHRRCSATGEIAPEIESVELEARDGKVAVRVLENGPALVTGHIEVLQGTGHEVATSKQCALCCCGASANTPFCDDSHSHIGFEADGT